jgi:hypothetical protein
MAAAGAGWGSGVTPCERGQFWGGLAAENHHASSVPSALS